MIDKDGSFKSQQRTPSVHLFFQDLWRNTLFHSKLRVLTMKSEDPGQINNDKYSRIDIVLDRVVQFIVSSKLFFPFILTVQVHLSTLPIMILYNEGPKDEKLSKDQSRELSEYVQTFEHEARQRGVPGTQITGLLECIVNGHLGKKKRNRISVGRHRSLFQLYSSKMKQIKRELLDLYIPVIKSRQKRLLGSSEIWARRKPMGFR